MRARSARTQLPVGISQNVLHATASVVPVADMPWDASILSVMDEFKGAAAFVNASEVAGIPRDYALEHQCDMSVKSLRPLRGLTAPSSTALIELVSKGPWTVENRKILVEAILHVREGHNVHATMAGPAGRKMQKLLFFDQVLTAREWDGIRGNAVLAAKIDQAVHRLWSLGVVNPSEPTTFRVAAIICLVEQISVKEKCEKVHRDLKLSLKNLVERKKHHPLHPVHYVEDYGSCFNDIPQEIRSFAYAGEPPVQTIMYGLDSIMDGAKMRRQKGSGSSDNNPTVDVLKKLLMKLETDGSTPAASTHNALTAPRVEMVGSVGVDGGVNTAPKEPSHWVFKPSLAHTSYASVGGLAGGVNAAIGKRRLRGKGPLVRSLLRNAAAALCVHHIQGNEVLASVRTLVDNRAQAKAVAKAKAKASAGRGRGVMKAMKGRAAMKAMKAAEVIAVLKKWRGVPKGMPTPGNPIDYKGGRIYLVCDLFRPIRLKGNLSTEGSFRRGRFSSHEQAFMHACKCIDDYVA